MTESSNQRRGNERQARAVMRLESSPRSVVDADGAVWDEVRGLPLQQRTVIGLHYLGELSVQEVADAMGIVVVWCNHTCTTHAAPFASGWRWPTMVDHDLHVVLDRSVPEPDVDTAWRGFERRVSQRRRRGVAVLRALRRSRSS